MIQWVWAMPRQHARILVPGQQPVRTLFLHWFSGILWYYAYIHIYIYIIYIMPSQATNYLNIQMARLILKERRPTSSPSIRPWIRARRARNGPVPWDFWLLRPSATWQRGERCETYPTKYQQLNVWDMKTHILTWNPQMYFSPIVFVSGAL